MKLLKWLGKSIYNFVVSPQIGDGKTLYYLFLTASPQGSTRVHSVVIGAYPTYEEAEKWSKKIPNWFPEHNAVHFGQYPKCVIETISIGDPPSQESWK